MASPIRVLVVDDSAFVRKVVAQMLSRSPNIQVVGAARDGEDALDLTERLNPDVITLDLVMPRMNGVEFLRRQSERRPVATVICSIAHESGEMAMEAFEAGAVDFVQKPTALATDRVYEIADELVAKVEAAAQADMSHARGRAGRAAPVAVAAPAAAHAEIVVIGISTGGPQALRQLIPRLPANFPVPIAMVLHMPVGYTEMYAQRLDEISHLQVVEVKEGAVLQRGVVWLAPAGRHLTFVRGPEGEVRAHLDLRPLDTQHRPAVDVLFRSAADVFGSRVLGIVMTGMGNDGLLGAAHIKANGGRIATEAESSCVVYGMPRAVDEASLSDRTATLDELPGVIAEMI
ncbi:MAG TPA: chemotaxis-specific protein-glutamate methyltransferase CheB [Gemmatimonadaceae bacterium]|nr:chemotaxis-specific protein-glutamate methyltransferase CheB [Gemmatimonadaceae bacterium]